jgi:glucose-6-phosphate isomerase
MNRVRCDRCPAWQALTEDFQNRAHALDLRTAFASDSTRFETLSQSAPHVFADLSKNRIDARTEALLMDLALQTGLQTHRDAMFAGERINNTEHRAVMHWLLRAPPSDPAMPSQSSHKHMQSLHDEVQQTLHSMLAYAEQVRHDDAITDVVNIGIGGSDLGPQMAVLALDAYVLPGKRFHFVSNVDGHELAAVLKQVKPHSTLFVVASKTFTTTETMRNARSAKDWFEANGGRDVARHFAALTTNVAEAKSFGIASIFGFWDWVGGRYSIWSAIGLPLAVAIGAQGFRDFLAGAHAMDEHFRTTPLARNLPVRLGLLDVWYRNFHGFGSRSIAPYHSSLQRYAPYLQQLEMESNGKCVDADGTALAYATSPVLWGEPGTNGQHAYFQMLHQGSDVVPVEFVAVKKPAHHLAEHHTLLMANVLAQAQALMLGQADAGGHTHFEGNRPSTFLLLDELNPTSLGALLALQEHRVFVSGSVWGINSFDQWGVELGQVLAKDVQARFKSQKTDGLDASTAGLLRRMTAP